MYFSQIDRLERRRLLAATGGISIVGQPVTVAAIPSAFAPTAACAIGANDTFIAYQKNGIIDGVILDSSGNTVVPEFPITSQNDTPYQFSSIAAAEDTNSNAVIVYSSDSGNTVEMMRVSSTGQIVNQSSVVIHIDLANFTSPAIAVASDNSVAIVFHRGAGNGASESIYGGVVDASDNPKFVPIVIGTISSNAPGSVTLSNASVVYAPSTGNFLAAWDEVDYNANNSGDTQELILANTFTPAGTAGTQQTIASEPNTSTSDNVLNQPILFLNSDNTTFTMYYDENLFSPAPNFTFGGSIVFAATINPDATLSGTPTNTYQTTAPNEIQLSAGQQYSSTSSDIGSSAVFNGKVQPLMDTTSLTNVLYGNMGTYNGGFAYANTIAMVYQLQALIVLNVLNNFAFATVLTDYFGYAGGFVVESRDTANNDTTVDDQPTDYIPPQDVTPPPPTTPTVSVQPGSENSTARTLSFTLSLDTASSDDVTVYVSAIGNPAYSSTLINQPVILVAGQTSATVEVNLTATDPPEGQIVSLTIDSASGANVSPTDNNALDSIDAAPPESTETATPDHPVDIPEPGNTVEVVSTTDGQVDVAKSSDGTLTFTVSGTNKKSKVLVIPKGKVGDFNVGDFISTSPVGTVDAPNTNIGGSINLNGVTSATFGNVKDNHQINLGALTNAKLKFADIANAELTSTGSIKSLSVNSWSGGSITAGSIAALSSAGNFDADMSVTSVSKMTVGGVLGGTSASDVRYLRASGSFGTITAAGIQHADLFAGIDSSITSLPSTESAFTNAAASIKSLVIKGASPIFSDADVAAATIDAITIAGLNADNATAFGVVAEKILKYKQGQTSKKKIVAPQTLDSTGEYSAATV